MPALLVSESSYRQLLDSLQSDIPKSLSIIGSLRNVLRGRLTANFFVDKWPDYSAVVCQYIWPRRSDVADIGAYATSSEALLSVLTDGDLVTWGRRQEFQRIEDTHADYLLEHLRPPVGAMTESVKCIHERIVATYNGIPSGAFDMNDTAQDAIKKLSTLAPDGYFFGRLQPHHAKMVTSQWPRLHGWPNKEPYFRELIKSCFCPALFSVDNPDVPISFIVELPCNQQFGWTNEKHRGKQLYMQRYVILFHNIDFLVMNGLFPLEIEISSRSLEYAGRIGGVPTGMRVKDLMIDSVLISKL